jgi:cytochrome c oxidase assembly protein subunit 15
LGRVVGLAFVLPLSYFALRKRLSPGLFGRSTAMALLIGAQGLLGWYMVQSGLDDSLMETPGAVPRVSQYRLAAHLGTAVALYAAMFGTGMAVLRDWGYARSGLWNGLKDGWETVLRKGCVRKFRGAAWAVTALVFVTAMSGAFVAGLDAGLLYNEFPYMGGQLVPPKDELLNPAYATKADKSDLWWRNVLENPTTVQFDHRVLVRILFFQTP